MTLPIFSGFSSAFNRALNSDAVREQLDNFCNQRSVRDCNIRDYDNDSTIGVGLVNDDDRIIPPGTVCNLYSGFFTQGENCSDGGNLPSDRKINVSFTFLSSNSSTISGGASKKRVRTTEKMTLIGQLT